MNIVIDPAPVVPGLLHTIQREYLEWPTLILTLPQAMRLWALDERVCAHHLDALVEAGFLTRTPHGYRRLARAFRL